jgi:hypothetical protein
LPDERAVFERWMEVHRRPSPMLTGHSGPLPGGAAALLVRDPDGQPGRLVVFCEPLLNDPLLDRALSDFYADEFQVPDLARRRIVAIAGETPNLDPSASSGPPLEAVARVRVGGETLARADALRRQIPELPPLEVAGVGPVRVLLAPQPIPIAWDALLSRD